MTKAVKLTTKHPPRPADHQAAAVKRACTRIEQDTTANNLTNLAADAGMSPWHFQRIFKAHTGLSPKQYAMACRDRATLASLHDMPRITDAIFAGGYESAGRFYEKGAKRLGMTPTLFKQGGKALDIQFAVAQCALGALLVARSELGICDIRMGDDADELVRSFEDTFPHAHLQGGDPAFNEWIAQVIGMIDEPGKAVQLPLDIRGTAFQERVWRALMKIPPGSTATYAEIAQHIGRPRAIRAVANACGANHLAIAVPCHRVVRTDGSLSGYRWGVDRKRALLLKEAALSGF